MWKPRRCPFHVSSLQKLIPTDPFSFLKSSTLGNSTCPFLVVVSNLESYEPGLRGEFLGHFRPPLTTPKCLSSIASTQTFHNASEVGTRCWNLLHVFSSSIVHAYLDEIKTFTGTNQTRAFILYTAESVVIETKYNIFVTSRYRGRSVWRNLISEADRYRTEAETPVFPPYFESRF